MTGLRGLGQARLRRDNTASLVQLVLTSGALSRAEIATRLGLSQGTVSKIVAPLVAAGLLSEQQPQAPGGGRPRVPVDVEPLARFAIGLHFGMARTTAGLVDLRGGVRATLVRSRRAASVAKLAAQAAELVNELRAHAPAGSVLGVGATTGGWVDAESGTVLENEALGWRDAPLRDVLGTRLDLPVFVESSVRAQAAAELWFGCAQQARSTVQLFVGNVIDAAVTVDRVVLGGLRSAAGVIAHLRVSDGAGQSGPLAEVATDAAVVRAARADGLIGPDDALPELVALARRKSGGPAAALLRRRATQVGQAVGLLVDLLDPELVVLAGGVLAIPEHIAEIRETLGAHAERGWDPARVVPTSLGADMLVNSSAAVVLGAYAADPLRFEPGLRGMA